MSHKAKSLDSLDDEQVGLLRSSLAAQQQERRKHARCFELIRYIIMAVVFFSYILLLCAYWKSIGLYRASDPTALGLEGIYDDRPPLDTYRQALKKAGFHRGPPNPYEGRPNEQNTASWDALLSVGMISISEEENSRLPKGGSGPVRANNGPVPGKYVVQTTVSHQLHCLKRLRELVWASEIGEAQAWQYGHASHCIDFLRQMLMCYADLTPIYMMWHEELHTYAGLQENIMQCRSWDAVVDWTTRRNATGLRVDGEHGKHDKTHGFVGDDVSGPKQDREKHR